MIVDHRIALLAEYLKGLMFDSSYVLVIGLTIFTLLALIYNRKDNRFAKVTNFLVLLLIILVTMSFFYKDNFWFNYFESVHYMLLIFIVIAFTAFKQKNRVLSYFFLSAFLLLNIYVAGRDISSVKQKETIGLASSEAVFDYIHGETGKEDYCLRIYTPPVIPHTYVYLMNYKARTGGYKISTYNFRNDKCYFIMESDPYAFRIDKWREENILPGSEMVDKKEITKDVIVETWALK